MKLDKHSMRRLIFCVLTGVMALGLTIQNGYPQGGGPPGAIVNALAIDPSTPTTLYAGTGNRSFLSGVFKSINGGASWTAVNSGLSYANLSALYVSALAIDPSTPATLYAGTNGGGVFKSTNGGASWTAVNSGLAPDYGIGSVSALAINPSAPATIYAGTTGIEEGVFKSTNGGSSWTAVNSGLNYTGCPGENSCGPLDVGVLAIDPSTPATIYAGTSGVFKSANGGASWTYVNSGLGPARCPGANSCGPPVGALAIDPSTPATIYAGTAGGVFKSANGGASWTAVNTGLTNTGVGALAIDPSTPATIYAGTTGGVFKSTNGGTSWTAVNSGLTNTSVSALAIDPSTPATLYAGTNGGGVFKSTDGGATWQPTGTSMGNGALPPPWVSQDDGGVAGGVVNGASFAGNAVAPGTIVAIFGTNLTDGTSCLPTSCNPAFGTDGRLNTTMTGARVTFNGTQAPILYSSPLQLGVEIPTELTGASATVQVTVGGQASAATVAIAPFSPGIFTFTSDGKGAGAFTHADGSPVTQQNPAHAGELVILYATGLGQVTPSVPTGALPGGVSATVAATTLTIDGITVIPDFAGLSGCCVGLNQLNVRLPANTRSASNIPVVLTIGGTTSNTVTLAVQ